MVTSLCISVLSVHTVMYLVDIMQQTLFYFSVKSLYTNSGVAHKGVCVCVYCVCVCLCVCGGGGGVHPQPLGNRQIIAFESAIYFRSRENMNWIGRMTRQNFLTPPYSKTPSAAPVRTVVINGNRRNYCLGKLTSWN